MFSLRFFVLCFRFVLSFCVFALFFRFVFSYCVFALGFLFKNTPAKRSCLCYVKEFQSSKKCSVSLESSVMPKLGS